MLSNFPSRTPFLNLINVDLLNDINNNGLQALKSMQSMKVDVLENDNDFVVHADIPGVTKESISVDFKDGTLTISVEEKVENEQKEGEKIWRKERSFSKRSRSFRFDVSLDEDQINGKYENGVLVVTLPKKINIEKNTKISIV